MTFGCGAAVASGSMMTTLAKGKTIEEAMQLTNKDVAQALGDSHRQKSVLLIWLQMHCIRLLRIGGGRPDSEICCMGGHKGFQA